MNKEFKKNINFIVNIKSIFLLLSIFSLLACKGSNTENNTINLIPQIAPIVQQVYFNVQNNDKLLVNYTYSDGNKEKNSSICWFRNDVKIKCGQETYYTLTRDDSYSQFRVEITPKPSSIKLNKTKNDTIFIKKIIEYQEIKTSFDKYIDIFKDRIHEWLQINNTFVLYNVQVHLLNAAIYADGRGDKEMLKSMLSLISIAFEEQYLTNGMWDDKYGNNIDPIIAQYFSLVTRVLSACERHGIDTNFSLKNISLINSHINKWMLKSVNRNKISGFNLFVVMSSLQFYDYLNQINSSTDNFSKWKIYIQNYMRLSIEPKWNIETCKHKEKDYECWALDRSGLVSHVDFAYAGYGREITKTSSSSDANAMFDANGTVKQVTKPLKKISMDISHARRFNWFFEVIQRFGKPFNVYIEEQALQGWANNLAYKVSKGTIDTPYFTIFSDGTDGWYRVNYKKRKNFGYAPGDMDIHFVGSSYGFFGAYNPNIYDWMEAWVNINEDSKFENGYDGGYKLDYLLSILIDIRKPLVGIK